MGWGVRLFTSCCSKLRDEKALIGGRFRDGDDEFKVSGSVCDRTRARDGQNAARGIKRTTFSIYGLLEGSSYCTNIRQLTLGTVYDAALELSKIWENLGGSLEFLSVCLVSSGEGEIRKVQKYCSKLKNIDISGPYLSSAALSKCLASYKGRLEQVEIYPMGSGDLEQVVRRCPNAVFKWDCSGGEVSKH